MADSFRGGADSAWINVDLWSWQTAIVGAVSGRSASGGDDDRCGVLMPLGGRPLPCGGHTLPSLLPCSASRWILGRVGCSVWLLSCLPAVRSGCRRPRPVFLVMLLLLVSVRVMVSAAGLSGPRLPRRSLASRFSRLRGFGGRRAEWLLESSPTGCRRRGPCSWRL